MMKRRAAIYIFIFAMLLPLMALREFTPANELRYLNIVDEALSNGNFITFYDHGMLYADKPPLYFWFAMLLKKVFALCAYDGDSPSAKTSSSSS